MDQTVIEILEKIHTSCNVFVNNYQETFSLPTKSKIKRKNELKGELNLVLEDINNIHKFCKDENSLKAAQEPKSIITRPTISRTGSESNSFATNFVRDTAASNFIRATKTSTATNSARTNGAATNSVRAAKTSATTTNSARINRVAKNSVHTSTNKVRTDTTSRNSLIIPATSSSIRSINSATRGVRTDLNNNNNNNNNNNINITSLGKRKNASSSGGEKKRKTN
ncbi:hypothetical protein Glove_91g11 [Diversispora epigaea]|uniref:Uncharacterized protein n=1 Tax=Diversispora epigaea TaxID=1348612 RepID=A0A397JG12_9GLOM|nr:hypothetical protein Glove_91g11 [Diversispora epigaea]